MNIMCTFSESVEKILKDTFQRWNMDWSSIDFDVMQYHETKMTDLPACEFSEHDVILRVFDTNKYSIDAVNFDTWLIEKNTILIYAIAFTGDNILFLSMKNIIDIAKDIRDKIMV